MRRLYIAAIFFIALFLYRFPSPASAAPPPGFTCTNLTPFQVGMIYGSGKTTTPREIAWYITRVDMNYAGNDAMVTPRTGLGTTTSQFFANYGLEVAVNGDESLSPTDPKGLAASAGDIYSAVSAEPSFFISPEKKFTFFGPKPKNIWHALSGSHTLLINGSLHPKYTTCLKPEHCSDVHPRTAIGVTDDNQLIMMVVDGRQPGHSIGVTLPELAYMMQSCGAVDAINMDGGGSSTMVVAGKGIVNIPSDGAERPVSNHLGICVGPCPVSAAITPTPTRHPLPTFIPLKYIQNIRDCPQVEDPEFHPLRPYPGSPCDPLIPKKIPEAKKVDDRKYLTFSCGNSFNAEGTSTFVDVVDVPRLPLLPANPTVGTTYRCSMGSAEVCEIREITVDLAIDLSRAEFPIMGNTQKPMTDSEKVNHYLSWYLNGTIQQSEQIPLNVDSVDDMNRLINYSGPLKKLLSDQLQGKIKEAVIEGPWGTDYHNYRVSEHFRLSTLDFIPVDFRIPILQTPFSSLEDITGELTIGLVPAQQPASPEIDGTIIPGSMSLTLGADPTADSRLYYPHLRNVNALSDVLVSISRPYPESLDPSSRSLITQRITEHQGIEDSTPVYRPDYRTGLNTRNTEIIPAAPAPPPLYPNPDITCEIKQVRTNQGDTLLGSAPLSDTSTSPNPLRATLKYNQMFRYTPEVSEFPPNCIPEKKNCLYLERCCDGSACKAEPPEPDYCDGPVLTCRSYDSAGECVAHSAFEGCYWVGGEEDVATCPPYPTVELKSEARVATYVKTPMVEKVYDTLVVGELSLMRRLLPQRPEELGDEVDWLQGEKDLTRTIPGSTQVDYGISSSTLNNARASAGDKAGPPEIFFGRLGSLANHILGGVINENLNLQRIFRPRSLVASVPVAGSCNNTEFPALPPSSGACNTCGGTINWPSDYMRQIFESAAAAYNVPVGVLAGIFYNEGGFEPRWAWNDQMVLDASGPNCAVPNCNYDPNGYTAVGPWQWIPTYWTSFANAAEESGISDGRTATPCNLVDATFAAAKKISLESGGAGSYDPPKCAGQTLLTAQGPAGSCSNWSDARIVTAARQYLGYCEAEQTCGYCVVRPPCALEGGTQNSYCYQRRTLNIARCSLTIP